MINRCITDHGGRPIVFEVLAFPRVTPQQGITSTYVYDTETNRFFVVHEKQGEGYGIEPVVIAGFPEARRNVRARIGSQKPDYL